MFRYSYVDRYAIAEIVRGDLKSLAKEIVDGSGMEEEEKLKKAVDSLAQKVDSLNPCSTGNDETN